MNSVFGLLLTGRPPGILQQPHPGLYTKSVQAPLYHECHGDHQECGTPKDIHHGVDVVVGPLFEICFCPDQYVPYQERLRLVDQFCFKKESPAHAPLPGPGPPVNKTSRVKTVANTINSMPILSPPRPPTRFLSGSLCIPAS